MRACVGMVPNVKRPHYNYFRDYDPATGRYVESDPIGLAGGLNTYAYFRNSPIDRYDPQGLQAQYYWNPSANRVVRIQEAARMCTKGAMENPARGRAD